MLCRMRVQIHVPVYESTPRPIYILHTLSIKLPRSAEVPHRKLRWVHDFDLCTQSPGHTVNYNGSVTLIHPLQSHGPVVSKICQSSTTRLWQDPTDRLRWYGHSDKVAMTRLLLLGRYDKVALTRLLWQGCSDKVALTRLLWQGRSNKVAMTRLLCQGCSVKVAMTRLLCQGCSVKVALSRLLYQGRSDKVALTRLLWLVALTCTSYSSNKHSTNFIGLILTIYSTFDPGTLAVTNRIW